MIKTNSKALKAKMAAWVEEDARAYIAGFDGDFSNVRDGGKLEAIRALEAAPEGSKEGQKAAAMVIYRDYMGRNGHANAPADWTQSAFIDFIAGLVGYAEDIYLRSANDLVGDLLEQTGEERAKYGEDASRLLAGYLYFRTVNELLRK